MPPVIYGYTLPATILLQRRIRTSGGGGGGGEDIGNCFNT